MFRLIIMSKKYTLTYFDVRGLGETPRLILNYANVDFEDKRLTQDEWANSNFKKGKFIKL